MTLAYKIPIFIFLVIFLVGCTTRKEAPPSIGQASMQSDGTIVLELRAEDSKGSIGEGRLVYPPSHPQYRNILQHLGTLKPGETKPVRPWE